MKKIIAIALILVLALAASCSGKPEKEDVPQVYILHVTDQNKDPVPETYVNFCTDTLCVPVASDENGTVTFDGDPDAYHVQVFKVPEGYSFDPEQELNIGPEYGEWQMQIKKD